MFVPWIIYQFLLETTKIYHIQRHGICAYLDIIFTAEHN